jgi:sarcosine oxidase subunit gamma
MSEVTQATQESEAVTVNRESPLHYVLTDVMQPSSSQAGIIIHERAHRGHLNLRGDPEDAQFRQGVVDVLGVELPLEACTFNCGDSTALYWLGPNEWLAIVAGNTERKIECQLRETLGGHFGVVDVSGGQTQVNVSGSAVEQLLKKSSVYDFHPNHFAAGQCVQTTFAKSAVMISKNADQSFDLVMRRSFSDYLCRWIIDASAEYGLQLNADA